VDTGGHVGGLSELSHVCGLHTINVNMLLFRSTLGEIRNAYKISMRNLKGRDHLEDLGINGITLEWILKKRV
jgi:hypothetical protein